MFDSPAPKAPVDVAALSRTLATLRREDTFHYEHAHRQYDAPRTVEKLARIKAARPDTRILAGSTDVGLWVTKQLRDLGDIVYVGQIASLQRCETTESGIEIGAGVSVERAYAELAKQYPELTEMWQRFASLPIRNAGTLGGNIANGSPIGDSMPGLIALGARVVLRGGEIEREMALEDLYLAYQKKDMGRARVRRAGARAAAGEAPAGSAPTSCRSASTPISPPCARRFPSSPMATCCAIHASRSAAWAATPKRAAKTEATLAGAHWHEASAQAAMIALAEDFAPLSDMRASSAYRLETAKGLLYRFWLETRPHDPLPKHALDVRAIELVTGA